jgi:hypothetical protein
VERRVTKTIHAAAISLDLVLILSVFGAGVRGRAVSAASSGQEAMREGDGVARPAERARHLGDTFVLLDRLNNTQRADLLVKTTELGASFFSLKRAWARAPKKRANHLTMRKKTRAHAHARLGREFDVGLQKT